MKGHPGREINVKERFKLVQKTEWHTACLRPDGFGNLHAPYKSGVTGNSPPLLLQGGDIPRYLAP